MKDMYCWGGMDSSPVKSTNSQISNTLWCIPLWDPTAILLLTSSCNIRSSNTPLSVVVEMHVLRTRWASHTQSWSSLRPWEKKRCSPTIRSILEALSFRDQSTALLTHSPYKGWEKQVSSELNTIVSGAQCQQLQQCLHIFLFAFEITFLFFFLQTSLETIPPPHYSTRHS